MKPNKISIGSHDLKSNISKITIGLDSLYFSKRITSKYDVFRKYDSLPALIFCRLFDIRNVHNSLHCEPFSNYLYFQNFSNIINQLHKSMTFFSNSVISTCDIRAYTGIQTSTICYNPVSIYQEVNKFIYPVSATGKTHAKSGNQNKFIRNIVHEKIVYEQIREEKKQYITESYQLPLCTRDILISINSMTLSYPHRESNLEFVDPKPSWTVSSAKKMNKNPINLNNAIQVMYVPSKNSVNLTIIYHVHNKNKKNFTSRLNLIFTSAKKVNKALMNTSEIFQRNDELSHQQTKNIQGLQYGSIFNQDAKFGRGNLVPYFKNGRILRGDINPSSDNTFPKLQTDFEYVYQFMKKGRSPKVSEESIHNSQELVFKKPAPQKPVTIYENEEVIQTEKVLSGGMPDHLIKDFQNEKSIHYIDMIADRVYRIIERRISIERDRSGLF
jgi:hypothetical protein